MALDHCRASANNSSSLLGNVEIGTSGICIVVKSDIVNAVNRNNVGNFPVGNQMTDVIDPSEDPMDFPADAVAAKVIVSANLEWDCRHGPEQSSVPVEKPNESTSQEVTVEEHSITCKQVEGVEVVTEIHALVIDISPGDAYRLHTKILQ